MGFYILFMQNNVPAIKNTAGHNRPKIIEAASLIEHLSNKNRCLNCNIAIIVATAK